MERQGHLWRSVTLVVAFMLLVPLGIARAAQGPPVGGETAASNLSFPVIWSDGVEKALPGQFNAPVFNGEYVVAADGTWYLQRDPLNAWRAESVSGLGSPFYVDLVDWGDNLEARDWRFGSKVRVETVLYQNLATPMAAFTMKWLSGQGMDEMWGTNTETHFSTQATVYSNGGRLTIQRIDPAIPPTIWDASSHQWTGTGVLAPVFSKAVYEAEDGPGYYNAEVNIQGKVIYGYNWDTRKTSNGVGTYRLTFSLDPFNTFFDAETSVIQPVEEGEVVILAEPTGNTAYVDAANHLTYIDVELTAAGGGGGPRR